MNSFPADLAEKAAAQFRVMVVDDVANNLKVVSSMLSQMGYTTTFAASGRQALERLADFQPDLILLDLMMPEMDGIEVCRAIKAMPRFEAVPIIFVTASHEVNHLEEAFEAGAVDYITKPFKRIELVARVKTHLKLKYVTDELRCKSEALLHKNQELQIVMNQLKTLATTDPLTGVHNRRFLQDKINQEWQRASRYSHPFGLLILDLDNFKIVNDSYGHKVGDAVLCSVVQSVKTVIRQIDTFARYGGEEFAVLLPETSIEQVLDVAERIRWAIEQTPIAREPHTVYITTSIGASTYLPQDTSPDEVFKRADQGLYQAKQSGKNQCCLIHHASVNPLA